VHRLRPGDRRRRRAHLSVRSAQQAEGSKLGSITKRRILYWLAAMVVVFLVGLIIGLIWADTSDLAGAIAGVTNVVAGAAILVLLIALAVVSRRERAAA
jgi:ABC-type proline/glycine betaine transport system permease subunit